MKTLQIWILVLACSASTMAHATDQVPYTFLVKSKDRWTLWNNYLGGAAIVIENQEAKKKSIISVDELLPEKEFEKFDSTAGPLWGEYTLWYFTRLGNRHVFRARTRYETDVLIDVEAAKVLKAKEWEAELRKADRREVAAILSDAAAVMKSPKLTLGQADRVHAAVVHAMHYKMDGALAKLQELESVDYLGAGVLPSESDPFTKQDPIDKEAGYWHYNFYETRFLATLALRRLGGTPQGYPSIGFLPKDKSEPMAPADRRRAVAKIHRGLTPQAVYELLGSPDQVPFGYWRYDIDDAKPFSVRVTWDDDGVVKSVEKVTPGLWQGDLHRAIDGY